MNIIGCIGTSIVNAMLLFGIASTTVPSFVISRDGSITGWLHIRESGLDQFIFNQQCILDESVLQLYSAPHILEAKPKGYAQSHRYYESCWLIDSKGQRREIWVESTLASKDVRFGRNYLTAVEHPRVANPVQYMAWE